MKYIVFIGIDGSGKTTAAENLCERLIENGKKVKYLHHSYSLLHFAPSFVRGNVSKNISKKKSNNKNAQKNFKSRLFINFLIYVSILDGFLGHLRIRLSSFRNDILVFDRYFYDPIFNFIGIVPDNLLDVFVNSIHKPDIVFFLDVSPEVAFKRKKEADIGFYEKYRTLYLVFLKRSRLKNVIHIDANKDKDIVKNEVIEKTSAVI